MWPGSKLLAAELRVNGSAAVVLHDAAGAGAAASRAGGGATRTRLVSEVAGLCSVTILSLPAHATLSVAVQHASPRTRSYLGLRKL